MKGRFLIWFDSSPKFISMLIVFLFREIAQYGILLGYFPNQKT